MVRVVKFKLYFEYTSDSEWATKIFDFERLWNDFEQSLCLCVMFQSMLQKLHYNSVCVKLVAILSHPIMSCLDGHFGPLLYVVHVIQAGSSSVSLAFYFPLNNVFCDLVIVLLLRLMWPFFSLQLISTAVLLYSIAQKYLHWFFYL